MKGAVLVVVVMLAALAGARIVQARSTFAAVCVDVRTATRSATDANCQEGVSTNYRWWYVPRGDTVPAVDAAVDSDQGTYQAPGSKSTVTFGFDPAGGVAP